MVTKLAQVIEQELTDRHGPVLGGEVLRQALGYASADAFRQALSRKQLPVPVFPMPHRRGKFALTKDVAHWLATLRESPPVKLRRPRKRDGGAP